MLDLSELLVTSRRRWRAAAVLLGLAALPQAQAQTPSALGEWQFSAGVPLRSYFIENIPRWQYTLGFATIAQPKYDGASQYEVQPGPDIDIRYRDIAFASTGEGLGWNIFHGKTYRTGVALTYDFGRRLNRDSKSRGLGDDVQASPEFKIFGEVTWFPVVFRLAVRRAIGGYDGIVADASAYLPVYGTKKFFVLVGPSVTWGDDSYTRQFFSVNDAESQTAGAQPFFANGGIASVNVGSSATWLIGSHWLANGTLGVKRLVGDAADSPTTKKKIQYGLALSINYTWQHQN